MKSYKLAKIEKELAHLRESITILQKDLKPKPPKRRFMHKHKDGFKGNVLYVEIDDGQVFSVTRQREPFYSAESVDQLVQLGLWLEIDANGNPIGGGK